MYVICQMLILKANHGTWKIGIFKILNNKKKEKLQILWEFLKSFYRIIEF